MPFLHFHISFISRWTVVVQQQSNCKRESCRFDFIQQIHSQLKKRKKFAEQSVLTLSCEIK